MPNLRAAVPDKLREGFYRTSWTQFHWASGLPGATATHGGLRHLGWGPVRGGMVHGPPAPLSPLGPPSLERHAALQRDFASRVRPRLWPLDNIRFNMRPPSSNKLRKTIDKLRATLQALLRSRSPRLPPPECDYIKNELRASNESCRLSQERRKNMVRRLRHAVRRVADATR